MHTKGPWRVDYNGDGTHCITAGKGCDIADTRSAVNGRDNARLLAAAPMLLEALEELLEFWDAGTAVQPGALLVQEIRETVAAAKGGAA